MKYLIYLILFVCFESCSSDKRLLEKIQGNWALGKDENVVFTIKNNDLKYLEDEGMLNLNLNKKVIELKEEGNLITKWEIKKITLDSLILKMEDSSLVKYVKIRK